MPVVKTEEWEHCVSINTDPYGKCAVDVARRVMEILDGVTEVDADAVISQADRELDAGITGFMAGCVAQMVSAYHSKGEDFRRSWNLQNQIRDEGERANQKVGAILNPALLSIG